MTEHFAMPQSVGCTRIVQELQHVAVQGNGCGCA